MVRSLLGTRANDNVTFRSLIQLDIDTQGVKDKATGRITEVTRPGSHPGWNPLRQSTSTSGARRLRTGTSHGAA